MKSHYIYLQLASLIISNYAIASSVNEDDSLLAFVKQLSLEESIKDQELEEEHQLAKIISGQEVFKHPPAEIPLRDYKAEEEIAELELALQVSLEGYLHAHEIIPAATLPLELGDIEDEEFKLALEVSAEENRDKNNTLKAVENEKISDQDFEILNRIFIEYRKTYNANLKNIEKLFFEGDILLPYLDNLFSYDEDDKALAERANVSLNALIALRTKVDTRLQDIEKLAKEQGILSPQDQKDRMIQEFITQKKCSKAFAEKAFESFIQGF